MTDPYRSSSVLSKKHQLERELVHAKGELEKIRDAHAREVQESDTWRRRALFAENLVDGFRWICARSTLAACILIGCVIMASVDTQSVDAGRASGTGGRGSGQIRAQASPSRSRSQQKTAVSPGAHDPSCIFAHFVMGWPSLEDGKQPTALPVTAEQQKPSHSH
jgi:hypothetical protein